MIRYIQNEQYASELVNVEPIRGVVTTSRSKPFTIKLWFTSNVDEHSIKITPLVNRPVDKYTIIMYQKWEETHWKYSEQVTGLRSKLRAYNILQFQHRFYNQTYEMYTIEYGVIGSADVRKFEFDIVLNNGYLSDNEDLDIADEPRDVPRLF